MNSRVYAHIGIDLAIWGAIVAASSHFWLNLFLNPFLYAAFVFRSFGFMHECVHSAAHSNQRVNAFLGTLYGVLSYYPYKGWRQLHLDHHRWTGNVEQDPSMRILMDFEKDGYRVARSIDLGWRYWFPVLGFLQLTVFWRATLRRDYVFIWGALTYTAACAFLLGPVVCMTGFLVYLYMVEIVNFPHHLGMEQHHGDVRYPAYEQNQFTRSCVYPKWCAHLFFLNFNLHNEHHLFPAHPWYQLDAIHEELKEMAGFNTCVSNEWILRNRKDSPNVVFRQTFGASEPLVAADSSEPRLKKAS